MKIVAKIVVVLGFVVLLAVAFVFRAPTLHAQDTPKPATPDQTPHIKLECSGCHGPGTKMPQLGGEQFHRDIHGKYATSIHAKIQSNGLPAAQCKDCHTVQGDMKTDLPPDNPKSTVFATNQEKTCGKCHEQQLSTFHNSIHGRLLDEGDTRAASCSDCHGNHTIQPIKDENSKLNREHLSEICIKCHSGIVPDYQNSAHGIAFREGNKKAPVCID